MLADSIEADIAAVARIEVVPKILDVVCRMTGLGFAVVARVTPERWIACAVHDDIAFGLKPGDELEVQTTICDEIRTSGEPVVIDHVAGDPLFRDHPTPKRYGFQSYISVPIRVRDEFFGTLCGIDSRPILLSAPETRATFELFAELIAQHLESQRRLEESEAELVLERQKSDVRGRFTAVLGHELRNPLASIIAGTKRLSKVDLPGDARGVVLLMRQSAMRMSAILENVLDAARGRGDQVKLNIEADNDLQRDLSQIVEEFRMAQPDRRIDTFFALGGRVAYDRRRLGQLVSNLLANALSHGARQAPVTIRARTTKDAFVLSVANAGRAIPKEMRDKLFRPFARGASGDATGLGLGLFIASDIAKAHGGEVSFTSDDEETVFTLTMPRG